MGTVYDTGAPENYTIGGLRFFFNEIISTQYQGYLYLGNCVTGGLTPTVDNLDHFSAKSGTRLKDRRVTRQISMAFNITLDEPNAANMNLFMFGAGITDVAAVPSTVVNNETAVIRTNQSILIPYKAPTAITVKKGATTLVLDTDYTITDVLGYKSIKRISSSVAVLEGDVVTLGYTYARPAFRQFKPATRPLREGKALIQGVSDIGNEWEYFIDYCSLAPNGDFTYNDQDWSQFQFTLEILDNSTAQASTPFGTMVHHGVGQNI